MYLLLKQNIKRLLTKKSTWIIFSIYIVLGIGNYLLIHSANPFANPNFEFVTSFFEYFVMSQGGGSGFMFIVLPLLVTLSTGGFFIEKRHSSILSYSLIRSNAGKYIRNEVLSTGITSFLFVFCAQTLLFACSLFFSRIGVVDTTQGMIFFATDLLYKAPLFYVLIIIVNSSLMAFFFSTFSICLSILFKNKYSAIMLPYVLLMGFSMVLMFLPFIFGLDARVFYDYAPLIMAGDYISIDTYGWLVSAYWIAGNFFMYMIVSMVFKNTFRREKLIIQ